MYSCSLSFFGEVIYSLLVYVWLCIKLFDYLIYSSWLFYTGK